MNVFQRYLFVNEQFQCKLGDVIPTILSVEAVALILNLLIHTNICMYNKKGRKEGGSFLADKIMICF